MEACERLQWQKKELPLGAGQRYWSGHASDGPCHQIRGPKLGKVERRAGQEGVQGTRGHGLRAGDHRDERAQRHTPT
eukprot:244869-Pelagomonas_calceolata.AAC.2